MAIKVSTSSDSENDVLGFSNGEWLPENQIAVSLNDLGFRQGVTAVERLRTYRGKIFAAEQHFSRWEQTIKELAIVGLPSSKDLASLLEQLLQRNQSFLQQQTDVGISMIATPGIVGGEHPTFLMCLHPIDFARFQRHCKLGQPVVITDVMQPPLESWSRQIKVRCRLHYYRADMMARSSDSDALGVLVDDDGSVTETSVANLAIVESSAIISPPADRVLRGVTQSVVEEIAADAATAWRNEPISPERLRAADEVLLMGTDGGLWFANSVDTKAIGSGEPGAVYSMLLNRFNRAIS